MTQLYMAALQKVTGAAAGPIATLLAPAGARPDIREIGIFVASAPATGPTIGFGRPAAVGAGGASGGLLGQATEPADPAATCTLAPAFVTTQPTAPAIPMTRITLPPSIGAGMVWTFNPQELAVAQSGNLVLWQFSALAVTYEVYMKWEE